MMVFSLCIWVAENARRADKSAVGAVNRPLLLCHSKLDVGEQGDREGRPYML